MNTPPITDRPADRKDPDVDLTSDGPTATRPHLDVALVSGAGPSLAVNVLDTFTFHACDEVVTLPGTSRKLLALLAIREQPMTRLLVAGTLWPDAPERDTASSLRSALWRLKSVVGDALDIANLDLGLRADVAVDLRESRALAQRLVGGREEALTGDTSPSAIGKLTGDLLPGWYDDWVLLEADEWHQLRLHALEALAARLTAEGRTAEAIQAALATVRAEPLRESAHGALIKSFIAEGNQNEALNDFCRFRDLLLDELGIEPSPQLSELVGGLRRRRTDR